MYMHHLNKAIWVKGVGCNNAKYKVQNAILKKLEQQMVMIKLYYII